MNYRKIKLNEKTILIYIKENIYNTLRNLISSKNKTLLRTYLDDELNIHPTQIIGYANISELTKEDLEPFIEKKENCYKNYDFINEVTTIQNFFEEVLGRNSSIDSTKYNVRSNDTEYLDSLEKSFKSILRLKLAYTNIILISII